MSSNDSNKPSPPSPFAEGQQPWTAPPANAPSGGSVIFVIVLVLGLFGLLALGCVGAALAMFWSRSVTVQQDTIAERLDAEMREVERLQAEKDFEDAERAKADAESQKLIEEFEAEIAGEGEWAYERSPEGFPGVIKEKRGGIWVENRGDGREFSFVEESRKLDFVELFDKSRNLQVRIYDDHLEWRRENQSWSRGQSGTWKTRFVLDEKPAPVEATN